MTTPEAPSAGQPHTPIVTDAVRLVRVLFSPGAVYSEQQDRPTFWWPWVIISVVYALLQFLQRPFQARIRELMMQRAGQPARGGGTGAVTTVLGIGGSFLSVLVISAIAAVILYLLLMAFGGETTYKKMLTVVIFTWPIQCIQGILTYVVLTMRGVASINSVWDMVVSFGVDLVIPTEGMGSFLRLFLTGIGPLQVWSVAITAIGLTVLGKVGKGAAWTAAIIGYLIGLALASGLGAFGMRMAGG